MLLSNCRIFLDRDLIDRDIYSPPTDYLPGSTIVESEFATIPGEGKSAASPGTSMSITLSDAVIITLFGELI